MATVFREEQCSKSWIPFKIDKYLAVFKHEVYTLRESWETQWSPEFRNYSIVREHPLEVCFNLNITLSAVRNLTERAIRCFRRMHKPTEGTTWRSVRKFGFTRPRLAEKEQVTRRRKLVVELRRSADMFSSPLDGGSYATERAPIRRFRY